MFIHLTIAQLAVFVPFIIAIGFGVGFVSGLFGVGGGFLIAPLLMLLGIPTEVAVATGANQSVATSASAALAQWQQRNVDLKVAGFLLVGGVIGSVSGVFLISILRQIGQVDFAISISYAVLLGLLGSLMLVEGVIAWRRTQSAELGTASHHRRGRKHLPWVHGLPLKTRFPQSKLYMSIIPPLVLGVFVGILGALMGVGGGFVLVPAMVYVLKMPTQVVVGTSLVQVAVVSSISTVMHASQNHTVDVQLAMLMILGGVVGAQLGGRSGRNIQAEQLRALLGLIVLLVGLMFVAQLVLKPVNPFSIMIGQH